MSQDVLLFKDHEMRVHRMLREYPYIQEKMGPFFQQCTLVLLTFISHASKKYLQNNFLARPSILANMIDNFNSLDNQM